MRIATNAVSESVLAQIQSLSQKQSLLQKQVATGQKVFNASDDPAAASRIITLDTENRQIAQFQNNATKALDLSEATYSSLKELKTLSDRANEIATLGAGASSADSYAAYAKEVNQLIEQAVQQGNTQQRNDYMFAGTNVNTAPFAVTRNASGDIANATYTGNTTQVTVQLSELSSIAPGTTGATNGGICTFINNLVALRDALNTASSTNVAAQQTNLDASENVLVNALSEQGAVQLRIETAQSQLTTRASNITKLISADADVDLASSVTRLSQTSTAYEAALSSATKILQMSLLDYLS
jgi:flagellar hook-associated protein 3 FlgL